MTSSNENIFRVTGPLCWGALMFSLICVWINGCVNNREAGDLRRHHVHYDVILMCKISDSNTPSSQNYITPISGTINNIVKATQKSFWPNGDSKHP